MRLPQPDFVMYKSLLSSLTDPDMDKNVTRALGKPWYQPTIALNINLEIHKLLEKCRFGRFWEELQAEHDMIIEFNGFEDAIRSYICGVISISFQRLSLENLKEFLGLANTQDVTEWIEKYGWTRDQGMVFVASQEEKVKVKTHGKSIWLSIQLF